MTVFGLVLGPVHGSALDLPDNHELTHAQVLTQEQIQAPSGKANYEVKAAVAMVVLCCSWFVLSRGLGFGVFVGCVLVHGYPCIGKSPI